MTDIITRANAALDGTTEGPWIVDGTLVYALQQHGWKNGDEVFRNRFSARVEHCQTSQNKDEAETNARFIAAAPDLIRDLIAEVERLRGVMNGIAMQPRLHEHEGEEGDFEYAYDMCVSIARAALNNNGEGD